MEEPIGRMVTRSAESWQFLAFVFGALLVLVYGLVDELSNKWLRIALKVGSFFVVGYFTLVNVWFRNILIGLLNMFTRETH